MASTQRILNPNNNKGRSLTGLENDTPHMHPELLEHLWVQDYCYARRLNSDVAKH